LASEIACAMMSMPPTSVDVRTLMAAPSASNCVARCNKRHLSGLTSRGMRMRETRRALLPAWPEICSASSRVGDNTSAKNGCGLSSSACGQQQRVQDTLR
jgi:hypothetical protein